MRTCNKNTTVLQVFKQGCKHLLWETLKSLIFFFLLTKKVISLISSD